jgi:hypothetical protein
MQEGTWLVVISCSTIKENVADDNIPEVKLRTMRVLIVIPMVYGQTRFVLERP